MPTKEEEKLLLNFNGDKNLLGGAEKVKESTRARAGIYLGRVFFTGGVGVVFLLFQR